MSLCHPLQWHRAFLRKVLKHCPFQQGWANKTGWDDVRTTPVGTQAAESQHPLIPPQRTCIRFAKSFALRNGTFFAREIEQGLIHEATYQTGESFRRWSLQRLRGWLAGCSGVE